MNRSGFWGALAFGMAIIGSGARAQTAIPPSPKDFLEAASQSDQYEILAAHVAEVQSADVRVRTFAEQMIRDHTRLSQGLRQAAIASGLPPPDSGMSSDEASLLAGLQSARGTAFDKAYARQQELVHAQASAVVGSFATAGADQNLKTAAQSAVPTIQEHLKMALKLREEVGGS